MKPPSGYPSENGATAPCGWTWNTNVTITGEIPGFDYGASKKITLGPIVYQGSIPTSWGRGSKSEAQFIHTVQQAILQAQADVNGLLSGDPDPSNGFQPEDVLTGKQANSLGWLLAHAEAQLEAAQEIYDFWLHRYGGSWPLTSEDDVASFYGPCVMEPRGSWVEGSRGDKLLCPLASEPVKREMDRARIHARLEDAVHLVRCAQWGMWRLVLYGRARRAWFVKHGIDDFVGPKVGPLTGVGQSGVGGLGAPHTGPTTPGGFGIGPLPPPPPPAPGSYGAGGSGPPPAEPDDFKLPDPKELPPPDQIPPDEGPVGEPGGMDKVEAEAEAKAEAKADTTKKVVATVGLAGLAWLLWKR